MLVLDTTSFNSTRRSMASILGLSQARLIGRLRDIDLETLDESRYLRETLWEALRLPDSATLSYARTYWHHAARVPVGWRFAEGILPLNVVLPRFWTLLRELVRTEHNDRQWQEFVDLVEANKFGQWSELYTGKVRDPKSYAGPYAFLIGDHAVGWGTVGIHDYLAIPEIVEDIGRCYLQHFKSGRLMARYRKQTVPRVVTFFTHGSSPGALEHALLYLHRRAVSRGIEHHPLFTACAGQVIPFERLVSVRRVRRAPRPRAVSLDRPVPSGLGGRLTLSLRQSPKPTELAAGLVARAPKASLL